MTGIPVSTKHPDHYIRVEAVAGQTVVWWDGFTGLTVVVADHGDLAGAIGAHYLVSVIDRHSAQTWAWAFDTDASAEYVAEKIPHKAFHKVWRQRLAASVVLMLRLHAQVCGVNCS